MASETITPSRYTPTPSSAHERITAAVRADSARPSQWAHRLGMSKQAMNHRLQGRTPWSLDEALAIATRLGTTVDALRDGTYLAHKREDVHA